jgi:cobalt/nickel transport system permease protein
MSDALLSPATGITLWAGAVTVIAYSARKLRESKDEKLVPLMGMIGAFIFAAQMINFTIPGTGSSGHLGGGMILAIILGPYAAFIVMASVLTIQAFFFADGGLLALGCNMWNLGVYPCFIAYPFIYNPLVRSGSTPKKIVIASLISCVAALQLGAFSVVLETMLSGRSELPFKAFLLFVQPIHLVIGMIEGFVTAGVINFIRAARPEILQNDKTERLLFADISIRKLLAGFLAAAVLTGGMLSWLASTRPDGLEWSIEKVFGRPELAEEESGIAPELKKLQEKTAFLPDYNFKTAENKAGGRKPENSEKTWPSAEAGTAVSGILGSAMVLSLIFLIGICIKLIRKKKTAQKMTNNGIR